MKILDSFEFKNRGYVIKLELLPEDTLKLGDHIKQNEHEWKIVGVEHVRPTSHMNLKELGFCVCVKPVNEVSKVPNKGHVK